MAVYKKDGTIYKLNGPNQIMFSQENWSCFTTYNLKNISNFKIESDIPHVIIGSKKEPSQRKDIISPIIENETKLGFQNAICNSENKDDCFSVGQDITLEKLIDILDGEYYSGKNIFVKVKYFNFKTLTTFQKYQLR
jgi:hypothetical protein